MDNREAHKDKPDSSEFSTAREPEDSAQTVQRDEKGSRKRGDDAPVPESPLMTVEETATLLRVSTSWVYKAKASRKLPYLKFVGVLRFDRNVVLAFARGELAAIEPAPTVRNPNDR